MKESAKNSVSPKLINQLGKRKDADIAREFGITRQRVGELRKERGIKACRAPEKMPFPIPVHFSSLDQKDIKRAMRVTGEENRSEYIRDAVRKKNKAVLEK